MALTPAGKAFLVDARRIVEDCDASIKKAQRVGRGEIGELSIGYMWALTHDFLGKALEVWRWTAPGIVVDCVKEADGAASTLVFVAAGFARAAVSEPPRRIPAKDVIFRNLTPEDRALMPVAAAWKPDGVTAAAASQFVDILAQTCATGNRESRAPVK